MRSKPLRPAAASLAALAAALLACASLLSGPAAAAVWPLPESDYAVRPVCPAPEPGRAACLSRQLIALTPAARAHRHPIGIVRAHVLPAPAPAEGAFGLRPQDLHNAYQLPTSPSAPQTIAIVDAYNDPTAEQDLKVYSEEFGLPACTTANGCFKKVNQNGESTPLPFPKNTSELKKAFEGTAAEQKEAKEAEGWALEISLDVQTAHAVCQTCQILLVEADTPSGDLYTAVDTAVALGADVISNSWGGKEFGESPSFNHPGVVITASAGDSGYLEWLGATAKDRNFVEYPASSPHVVAVGGTRLQLGPGGAWSDETVWNDGGEKAGKREGFGAGGGGCSKVFTAASWQQAASTWSGVGCATKRAVADISADADPYMGLAVRDTTGFDPARNPCAEAPHWCTIGGTSLASPIVAAVFALAGGANGAEYPARTLYENAPAGLHDVTQGSNGECTNPFEAESGTSGCTPAEEAALSCSSAAICLAGPGYDGPTGVGTPFGIGAFTPGFSPGGETGGGGTGEGGEGGGGGTGSTGNSGQATTAGPVSVGTTASTDGESPFGEAAPAPGPVLSALRLTRTALAALNRAARRVSAVRFSFRLSSAARVTARLAAGTRIRSHWRFKQVGAQAFAARRGSQSLRLGSRASLRSGRYRLTVTPANGLPVSISFQIR